MTDPAEDQDEIRPRAEALFRPGTDGRVWLVLHARPRREKKAAGLCADLEVPHYLPLRRKTHPRRKGQRQYTFDVPLFSGYLFACCGREERFRLLQSDLLVRTMEVVDQAQLLEELLNIYLAASQPVDLTLYPQLKRGRRVRVTAGPLQGIVGRISERRQGLRLVLNVTMLGTAVATEIDMDSVALLTS